MKRRKTTGSQRARDYAAAHPQATPSEIAHAIGESRQLVHEALRSSGKRGPAASGEVVVSVRLPHELLSWLDAWIVADAHESRGAAISALIQRERAESPAATP